MKMGTRVSPAWYLSLAIMLVCTWPWGTLRAQDAPAAGADAASSAPAITALDQGAKAVAAAAEPTRNDGAASPSPVVPEAASVDAAVVRSSSNRLIEEIIVTSQKREENLRDVPISVAAFSAEALDALGVVTTKDLALITPGMQYDELASFSVIFLRGVGTDVFLPSADGAVATYIDGIYFPFANSLAQDLGALERIEVLKGPQGTLFGRNSTGGAISIITRKPTQQPTFSAQYSYGSFDESKLRLFASGPVSDSLLASVSFIHNTGDPYYKVTSDAPLDGFIGTRNTGVQAKLLWQPVDDFDVTLNGMKVQLRAAGSNLFVQSDIKPLGILLGASEDTGDPYEVSLSAEPFNYTNNSVGSLTANYRPGPLDVKLLTSYQTITTDSQNDYDGSKADVITFRSSNLFAKVFTGELQLISNSESWGAERFKWIAGAYFIDSTGGFDPVDVAAANRTIPDLTTVPIVGGVALPIVQSTLDALNAVLGDALLTSIAGVPIPPTPIGVPDGVAVRIAGIADTSSPSAFAQGTFNFTDWVALTLGVRYQKEKRTLAKSRAGLLTTNGSVTPLFDYPSVSKKTSDLSPKATLELKPGDDSLIFLTYAKASKSGTYNSVNIINPPQYVEPEEITSYEFGTKTDFFDRRVRLTAAVFQNEITDLQVQFISLLSGGIVSLENAPKATSRGVDFDLLWSITDSLVLTAGGAYLDGEFDDFPSGRGFDPTTGISVDGRDFSGNTTPRTPEFTGNLGLNYSMPLGRGTAELGGDTYYNSGFFYDNQNSISEGAYQIYNARVSYLYEPWNLRTTLFGSNLTDEIHHLYRFVTDFGVGDTLAAPRTFGIRLNWEF